MHYRLRSAEPEAAAALGGSLGVSAAMAQVLLNRGIGDPARARSFLRPRLSQLSQPEAMVDRGRAADRLAKAVREREPITVFGDYDVDGVTSAAILGGIVEQLGGRVRTLVADRFAGGYGLSDPALDRVLAEPCGVLVTTDCGSSDHERVARASAAGIDVIVVDHHLVPEQPLPALAFLNPHRPDCGFAYKGLCSAGLALTLGAAVRAALDSPLDLRDYLDLVALGTIGDVAPLDGDNRALVRAGLARLSSEAVRPGIAALREMARVRAGSGLGAVDVAFKLTPRLNAPGRLGDSSISLQLLQARSVTEARALAARIEQLNDERKALGERVTREALEQHGQRYGESAGPGRVLAGEGWHRGVVGISAARLADRFGAAVAVIAVEGDSAHGSVRGGAGVNLHQALSRAAATLQRFGGHGAAAGFSLAASDVDAFRKAFEEAVAELASAPSGAEPALAEAALGPGGYPLPTADELWQLEPLGQANAEPVFFFPEAKVRRARVVGDGHLKLELEVSGQSVSGFGLGLGDRAPRNGSTIQALGALRPDTWKGGSALEIRLTDFA
ncbi:MAG: single-stranded-DNA-specific exonuclease RecJ [Myxococcales bacterium]|nr:single-stranded-DNA-specific exonuclease RecJ [Myxococcales bacterium]